MNQANDESNQEYARIPPSTFNLIDHPFRPTRHYQFIEGFADTIQALEQQGRYRSGLEEIFKVLDSHPGHPEAFILAMILLGESRTNRRRAKEPLPEAYLYDTRLDPIYAVCSHCQKTEWVPEAAALMQYAKFSVLSPVGSQCYNCGYVVCRNCRQSFDSSVGISILSRNCPHCHEDALDNPVFPTGRLPHQMVRHAAASIVSVIFFREGPIPPDEEYMQKLLAFVSPDIFNIEKNGKVTLTAFPVPSWPDDMDGLALAILVRMEGEGKLPAGSNLNTERALIKDTDGVRSYIVKVMRYDLSRLGLPREGQSFEEAIENEKKAMAASTGASSVSMHINGQDLAIEQETESPVVRALGGRAFVVLRLDGLSPTEERQMGEAIGQSRVLLVPVLAQCPTFPVLALKFVIYDNLTNPYIVEGPRGIHDATIQDFLQAVLQNGGGDFYLYAGLNAEPLGSGKFSLRMPPFDGPGFPYSTQITDLENCWQLLLQAAQYLESIPAVSRDFQAAARFYLEHS